MAKDGTMRGGQRVGAGRKSKALTDKIADGRLNGAMVLPEPAEIEGAVVPPVKEYLKAAQKNGKDLCAEEVYRDTWNWLKARGCEMLVNNQLIEQYAMSVSRWIQCEEAISEFGFLAKHPTTGNAIASPYVAMSQTYMKQVMVSTSRMTLPMCRCFRFRPRAALRSSFSRSSLPEIHASPAGRTTRMQRNFPSPSRKASGRVSAARKAPCSPNGTVNLSGTTSR